MKKIILIIMILIMIPTISYSRDFPSDSDVYWLTQNVYHESRDQSFLGQMMVAIVTLERLKDGRWGNSIKKVVTARKQFSWYSDGLSDIPKNKKAWKESKRVAKLSFLLYNEKEKHGIMFYHNHTVQPYWSKDMIEIAIIGNHTFYTEK